MSKTRYCLFIVAVVVVSGAVCVFAASPRFYLWQCVDVPGLSSFPEVNRAISTAQQLETPFTPIDNPSNAVIQWRLLFPLIAWATSMPFEVYLTLPFIGVALLLGWIAHVVYRETRDARTAALAAALAGTTSWFFVSTGWLTYFDSWYLLGALVVALARPTWAIIVATLLCPWIDERFVLTLPLCLAVRAVCMGWVSGRRWGDAWRQSAWVVAATAPCLLFRLAVAISGTESMSGGYLRETLFGEWSALRFIDYVLIGAWHGLRAAWLAVIVFLVVAMRRCDGWRWKAAILVGVVGSLAVNLLLTGDYSRSASVLLPAVVGGIVLAGRLRLPKRNVVLGAIVVVNLMLPAAHVFGPRIAEIHWFPPAWEIDQHPEGTQIDPMAHVRVGNEAMRAGDVETAVGAFTVAVDLDPDNHFALINRAAAYTMLRHWDLALADVDEALTHAPPDWPEAETARFLRQRLLSELDRAATESRDASPR